MEQRKKQLEEEKKEKEKAEEVKKKQMQRLHEKVMADGKVLKESEQSANEKIQQLFEKAETQSVLSKNSFQLHSLYEFLQKSAFKSITEVVAKSELPLKTVQWFCARFHLVPEIVKLSDCILIFRSIVRNKPKLPDGSAPKPALDFEEFSEFLLRLAIKGRKVFSVFAEKLSRDGAIQAQDMQKIINQENGGGDVGGNTINDNVKEEDLDKEQDLQDGEGQGEDEGQTAKSGQLQPPKGKSD